MQKEIELKILAHAINTNIEELKKYENSTDEYEAGKVFNQIYNNVTGIFLSQVIESFEMEGLHLNELFNSLFLIIEILIKNEFCKTKMLSFLNRYLFCECKFVSNQDGGHSSNNFLTQLALNSILNSIKKGGICIAREIISEISLLCFTLPKPDSFSPIYMNLLFLYFYYLMKKSPNPYDNNSLEQYVFNDFLFDNCHYESFLSCYFIFIRKTNLNLEAFLDGFKLYNSWESFHYNEWHSIIVDEYFAINWFLNYSSLSNHLSKECFLTNNPEYMPLVETVLKGIFTKSDDSRFELECFKMNSFCKSNSLMKDLRIGKETELQDLYNELYSKKKPKISSRGIKQTNKILITNGKKALKRYSFVISDIAKCNRKYVFVVGCYPDMNKEEKAHISQTAIDYFVSSLMPNPKVVNYNYKSSISEDAVKLPNFNTVSHISLDLRNFIEKHFDSHFKNLFLEKIKNSIKCGFYEIPYQSFILDNDINLNICLEETVYRDLNDQEIDNIIDRDCKRYDSKYLYDGVLTTRPKIIALIKNKHKIIEFHFAYREPNSSEKFFHFEIE